MGRTLSALLSLQNGCRDRIRLLLPEHDLLGLVDLGGEEGGTCRAIQPKSLLCSPSPKGASEKGDPQRTYVQVTQK